MLRFNFEIGHIAGLVNTAADFLSRQEKQLTEKARLKNREDVQTTPIEVTTSSSDVADEEQFFITQTDGKDETEDQTLEKREVSEKGNRRGSTCGIILNEAKYKILYKHQRKHFVVLHERNQGKCTDTSGTNFRSILKNRNIKRLGQPLDKVLLTTDRQFKHYTADENRIFLK